MKTMCTLLVLALGCVVDDAAEIERETFSMTLPEGWTEDTKDDLYDANSFVMFENAESCLFTVIVGKNSAGATVEDLVKNQREEWQKRVTEAKSADITVWSKYEGKGFELEGKVQGVFRSRARIFGFQNGDNVCVVIEFGALADLKKFASDFEKIRQTFKLK
jgi:hypothetical protein